MDDHKPAHTAPPASATFLASVTPSTPSTSPSTPSTATQNNFHFNFTDCNIGSVCVFFKDTTGA